MSYINRSELISLLKRENTNKNKISIPEHIKEENYLEYIINRVFNERFEKRLEQIKSAYKETEKCKTYIPTTKTSNRCSICGELKYNHE